MKVYHYFFIDNCLFAEMRISSLI